MRAVVLVALVGLLPIGCYSPIGVSNQASRTALPGVAARCPGPDTGPRVRWRKRVRSSATASLHGVEHHSSNDPIINPGQDAVVDGKFAYGTVSKDLEGEEVALWLRMKPCGDWREIDVARTNGDGRLAITVPRNYFSGPGAYPYQLIVRGDLTRSYGTIYVVEPKTEVVVFDIDGTLTTGDSEVVKQVAFGSEPDVQRGAAEVVDYYVRAGYLPIYITGRPYILRRSTAAWLQRHGFAPGPLITTDRFGDSRPGHKHVGKFKRGKLGHLRDEVDLDIIAAYGNADSDVCAYSIIGIPAAKTFIVGSRPKRCKDHPTTQALPSYVDHLDELRTEPLIGP